MESFTLVARPAVGPVVENAGREDTGLAFTARTGLYPYGYGRNPESITDAGKSKLVKRLSRIRGQVDALHRAITEQDAPSATLLQQATACRCAMDGFIAEVIEDHIREKVVEAATKGDASRAAGELISIVHSYLTWPR